MAKKPPEEIKVAAHEFLARADVDEVRAALAGWRPIEAAPKDGTEVLLWWPFYKLDDDGNLTDEPDGGRHIVGNYVGGWQSGDEMEGVGQWFGDDSEPGHEPTHWMSLPAPPTNLGSPVATSPSNAEGCCPRPADTGGRT